MDYRNNLISSNFMVSSWWKCHRNLYIIAHKDYLAAWCWFVLNLDWNSSWIFLIIWVILLFENQLKHYPKYQDISSLEAVFLSFLRLFHTDLGTTILQNSGNLDFMSRFVGLEVIFHYISWSHLFFYTIKLILLHTYLLSSHRK